MFEISLRSTQQIQYSVVNGQHSFLWFTFIVIRLFVWQNQHSNQYTKKKLQTIMKISTLCKILYDFDSNQSMHSLLLIYDIVQSSSMQEKSNLYQSQVQGYPHDPSKRKRRSTNNRRSANSNIQPSTTHPQQSDHIFGISRQPLAVLLMSFGCSLITLGFVYSTEMRYHPVVTGFIRGLAATIVPYLIARYQDIDLTFASYHNFKWQFVRNGIMFVQGYVYAWSQYYLPLPIVVTLYASTPVFTAIFDYFVFGVAINKKQKMWLLVAVAGVVLTANGAYLQDLIAGDGQNSQSVSSTMFGDDTIGDANGDAIVQGSSVDGRYFSKDPKMALLAGVILALTQCLHGLGVVTTKKLNGSSTIQVTYFVGLLMLIGNAVLLPSALAHGDSYINKINESESQPVYHNPTMSELSTAMIFSGLPLVLGMLGFNASLTITRHYGMVAPFQFASIVVGYFLSVLRYGESLNVFGVLGTFAICVGVVYIVREREKVERQSAIRFGEEGRQHRCSYDSELM